MKHIIAISVAIIFLCAIDPSHSSVTCEEPLERIPLKVEKILGQPNERETMLNRIAPNRGFYIGGVHVDTSCNPNRIYILDTGNNRILGFEGYKGPKQHADIVIGQELPRARGTANTDNTKYMPARANTLALLPYPNVINPKGSPRAGCMATDEYGNLYIVDLCNNRILKYNDPFTTDTVADEVWGQEDFIERKSNRGRNNLTAETLSTSNRVIASGVDIDSEGNLWVTDSGNHRVLRYPNGSKTADLVLGQEDFEHKEASPLFNKPLNRMRYPSAIKIYPNTGNVYVLEGKYPGDCRILVFESPFTNGMSASKEIGRAKYQDTKPEKPYNAKEWKGFDTDKDGVVDTWANVITGLNRANGFTLDPLSTEGIAVSDCNNNRVVFFDEEGSIKKIITEYTASNGSIKKFYRPSGEIGLDEEGNLYVVSMGELKGVIRYNPLEQEDTESYLIEPNGFMLKSTHWNSFSRKTFHNAYGFSVSDTQLYVSDAERLLIWDRDNIETFGKADYVLGQENFGENFTKKGIFSNKILGAQVVDKSNRLWVSTGRNIYVFQTPITQSELNPSPIKVLTSKKNVYWKDDTETAVEFKARGIYYNYENETLWIVDHERNRALHIKDPLGEAVVDLVIGQNGKNGHNPNGELGEEDIRPWGLSSPSGITMDKLDNLYIIDATVKLKGNRRVIRFSNAEDLVEEGNIFPLPKADGVFTKSHLKTRDIAGARKNAQPVSPNWVTFNSENHMVLLADSFGNAQNERAYLYYTPHEGTSPQPGRLIEYPFGQAAYAHFDEDDNLIIQDHTWNRILFGRLPYVKKTLPQPPPPTEKPDLIIAGITYETPDGSVPTPGTEVAIKVRVKNIGSAPTAQDAKLAIGIIDSPSMPPISRYLWVHWPNSATELEKFLQKIPKGLAPGDENVREFTFTWVVDNYRDSWSREILAYVDWAYISFEDFAYNFYNREHINRGVIDELDEFNNRNLISFPTHKSPEDKPDLYPDLMSMYFDKDHNEKIRYFPQLSSEETKVYVAIGCSNIGNACAVPNPEITNYVLVEFKDAGDNIIHSIDGPLGEIPFTTPLPIDLPRFRNKFPITIPGKDVLDGLHSITISYTSNPNDRNQDSRYKSYKPIDEITYTNNTISRKFLHEPVVKEPDLIITNIFIDPILAKREIGKPVKIRVIVKNNSMYNIEEDTKLAVLITDLKTGPDKEEYLFWPVNEGDKDKFLSRIPPLDAWASTDIEFTWIFGDGESNNGTPMEYDVYAYADFKYKDFGDFSNFWRPYYINEGKIEEKYESNNRKKESCYILNYPTSKPDLIISQVEIKDLNNETVSTINYTGEGDSEFFNVKLPYVPSENENYYLCVTAKNIGGKYANNSVTFINPLPPPTYDTRVFLPTNGIPTRSSFKLDPVNIWHPPYKGYPILIEADFNDDVDESNEHNNDIRIHLMYDIPDFTISNITIEPADVSERIVGTPITFNVDVYYFGPELSDDVGPKIVGAVFGEDGLIWPTDSLHKFSKNIKPIQPDQTKTISFTWTPEESNSIYEFITYVDWKNNSGNSDLVELEELQNSGYVNNGVVDEVNESDNKESNYFSVLPINPLPPRAEVIDLTCNGDRNELAVHINEGVNIVARVQNKGTRQSLEDALEIKAGDDAPIHIDFLLGPLEARYFRYPGTVAFSTTGDYTVTASVGTSRKSMVIHVVPENHAPEIMEIEEDAHIEADRFYYLKFKVRDLDGDAITVEVSGFDDFDAKAPSGFIVPPEGVEQTIRILPRGEHIGKWRTGTLTVSDGEASDSRDFRVFVEAPAPEPFIEIIEVNVSPDTVYEYKPVTCNIRVKNIGTVICYEQDLRLDIVMTWNTYSLLTETINICDEGELAPGEERTFSYTWDRASASGKYYFSVVTGYSYGGAGCEVLPYKVEIMNWTRTSDPISEDQTVDFEVTVRNSGDVICEEEYLNLYVTYPGMWSSRTFNVKKNICDEEELGPGEVRKFTFTWDKASPSGWNVLHININGRYPGIMTAIYVQPNQ